MLLIDAPECSSQARNWRLAWSKSVIFEEWLLLEQSTVAVDIGPRTVPFGVGKREMKVAEEKRRIHVPKKLKGREK